MKHYKRGLWSICKILIIFGLLLPSLFGCDQISEEIDYEIIQLKKEEERKENEYSRLNRNAVLILEVEVLDRLSIANSVIFYEGGSVITDFYSYRNVHVKKVLKGSADLENQTLVIREPLALGYSIGYEYYPNQLETALVGGLTYIVFLEDKDIEGIFPISNDGQAKWALNNTIMTEEWVLLTFLNYYAEMSPRKTSLRSEESFEYEDFELIYIALVGIDNRIEYYYDAMKGRTFFNMEGKYYSVSGKVSLIQEIIEE